MRQTILKYRRLAGFAVWDDGLTKNARLAVCPRSVVVNPGFPWSI